MDNSGASVRQIARLLKKIHIEDGDIIALRHRSANANIQTIESLTVALDRIGLSRVLVVVVDDFDDMRALDEREMNKRGWFRLDKLIKPKHREENKIDPGSDLHV